MSIANVVFKINEVAKEFGFILKEKQKHLQNSLSIFW